MWFLVLLVTCVLCSADPVVLPLPMPFHTNQECEAMKTSPAFEGAVEDLKVVIDGDPDWGAGNYKIDIKCEQSGRGS
jgi:hypothetical protein